MAKRATTLWLLTMIILEKVATAVVEIRTLNLYVRWLVAVASTSGVLIRDVDHSCGVDVPMDEKKSDLISSLGHVEKVEAETEASDGEFLQETDEELEVETFSAEHDASAGVYAVYLLNITLMVVLMPESLQT